MLRKKLCFLAERYQNRPGSQTIHAFNRSLRQAGISEVRHHFNKYVDNIAEQASRKGWGRNWLQRGKACLVAMMWPDTARLLPAGLWAELIPLCFDCWPKDYSQWEQIFHNYNIRIAFFTARQSAEYFQRKMPNMISVWMPEAADPEEYNGTTPLEQRTVDVLELGRRSELYHLAVMDVLRDRGCQHLYVPDGARRMFSTREQLMATWRQTKISICFPKSFTDPERSGGVETVTFRYFESMSSKCLIVGHCPKELEDMFGFNPVIEADLTDCARQLLSLLADISSYQNMVEKNYRRLLEVGSWNVRVEAILAFLRQQGYAA